MEFSKALDLVAVFSERAEETYNSHEKLADLVNCKNYVEGAKNLAFKHKTIEKLSLLGILMPLTGGVFTGARIEQKNYRNKDYDLDLDFSLMISNLELHLSHFIKLFNWYLQEVIQKLEPINRFTQSVFKFELDNLISFN